MQIDNEPKIKEKSSGITICTGTGSTSWHFHINQLSTDAVESILNICKYMHIFLCILTLYLSPNDNSVRFLLNIGF